MPRDGACQSQGTASLPTTGGSQTACWGRERPREKSCDRLSCAGGGLSHPLLMRGGDENNTLCCSREEDSCIETPWLPT